MIPRLSVIAGPNKDSSLAITAVESTIGRDPGNAFAVSDPSLSRRHCVIICEGERFKIRDLASRNGTFVNGVAVKETWLQHGDQISIGDSIFVFLLNEDQSVPVGGEVEFQDDIKQATAQLRPQDVLYLHPEKILSQLPETSRLAENLNALLKISRVVHAISDLDALQEQILSLIFEVTPAERGAILLDPKGSDRFGATFARCSAPSGKQTVQVSRTITRQVVEKGIAILSVDVPTTLKDVESLAVSNVRGLICVPLTVFHRVMGCIYVDTINPSVRLDEDHMQMLAAIAGICAVALENARRLQWLEQENLRLTAEINVEHNMVGESPRIKEVYKMLARVAKAESTVLLEGESGTGKEVAARAIHKISPRAGKPFAAINCAAIPEGLLESELFGHEKGAFSGAVSQRKGKFEMAEGGVVFLDEIGELAPPLQVKLLRVLQEREIERLGGNRTIPVNIRLIAATNRDLKEAVKEGNFRQDLYFRLNVVPLRMPPLRERLEDIPLLTQYFVAKHSKKCNLKPKAFSSNAMACLLNYDWPGNVRELENSVERALVMSVSEVILPEDLPEAILEKNTPGVVPAKYHTDVQELKKKLIIEALENANGNYTEAAHALGIHPNYLHRLIRNLDLKEVLRTVGTGKSLGTKVNRKT